MKSDFYLFNRKILNFLVAVLILIWMGGKLAWAEPQFGGDVSNVIRCTCGENAGGVYFIVGDPHGDENGNLTSYVAPPGVELDCTPIQNGEETLGMHTNENTECKIQVHNDCITIGTGKKVEYFGSSPATCPTGLEGDASGDGKSEMMTPDGRTADGGDWDDGGPSGGPSNARQHDRHLKTVDGVMADGTVNGSGETEHMETPDHQNYEGSGTTKMVTAPTGRKEDGTNSSVFTSSGSDDGYSPAGAGIGGEGYGSVGGSVGSGGLQSPVVLGNKNETTEKIKNKKNYNKKIDIEDSYNNQKNNIIEMLFNLMIVIGGIGGAGYFVFKSIKKVFS